MSRTFALPVIFAGAARGDGRLGGHAAVTPGFVDPKPILDAAIKAIGNDKLNCVTISGDRYDGAVGQQKEAGKNVDWPRPDQLANYTRTMNWQAKTMKEEFDRKPGLTPAAWKYGIGWLDGPLQTQTASGLHAERVGPEGLRLAHGRRDGSARAERARRRGDLPDRALDEPAWVPQGRADAGREPEGDVALGARRDGPRRPDGDPERSPTSSRSPRRADSRSTRRSTRSTCSSACTRVVPDPVLGDMNYEHEFTNDELYRHRQRHQVPDRLALASKGYDDNFSSQNISAGHNAFGGTMKDVKANVCPDAGRACRTSVRNCQFPGASRR